MAWCLLYIEAADFQCTICNLSSITSSYNQSTDAVVMVAICNVNFLLKKMHWLDFCIIVLMLLFVYATAVVVIDNVHKIITFLRDDYN